MKLRNILIVMMIGTSLLINAVAMAAIDPDAEIIHVRKDCGAQDNCFGSMGEALTWTWGTRNPSASAPLTIDVGPGDYLGFSCNNNGYVTVKGAGRDSTTFVGGYAVVNITNCNDLSFQDLTVKGFYAIVWSGGGSSTYTNVDVVGRAYGWYDYGCTVPGDIPLHYWFGSTVTATAELGVAVSYFSQCGENWFYGGEIASIVKDATSPRFHTAVAMTLDGDMRMFGTAVRVIANPASPGATKPLVPNARHPEGTSALAAMDGGVVHMHGGIVNVTAVNQNASIDNTVAAIFSNGVGSFVHTPGIAYTVKPNGNGIGHRIFGDGSVQAPYHWPNGTTPPTVQSQTGSDVFVENDCGSGGCQAGGDDPHMLVYSENCLVVGNAGPWFDIVTGSCRVE